MNDLLEWEELDQSDKAAIRLLSERSFLAFLRIYFQLLQGERWSVNWHHRLIASKIEQIVRREAGNTIFNVPPGSGKTEMLSIHAPVWSILNAQKVRNLNLSFSDTLTKRNSRRTRDIIKSSEFQELWPHDIGVDQADEWQLLNAEGKVRAEVISRSMSGQVTGSRGGYIGPDFSGWICLDDPDKPEAMFSEIKRKKSHELLVNTIRSRRGDKSKKHPTPVVTIQQRLHVDDSTAFMMSGGMGLDFDLVKVPALLDEEYIESLPEPFRSQCWADVKGTDTAGGFWSFWPANEYAGDLMTLWESDPYTFLSQYQQAPEQLSGGVFNADAFGFYSDDPEHGVTEKPPYFEYRFITADTAQKTGERNDYSVFAHWGVYQGKLYLIDLLRGKWEAPALRSHALTLIQSAWAMNGPVDGNLRSVLIEDKSSGTGLIQDISAASPCPITPIQRNRDKYTRSLDCQGSQHAGKVLLPYGAPYNVEFIAEVASFAADDSHKHDDQTDVMMDAIDHAILQEQGPGSAMIFKRRR